MEDELKTFIDRLKRIGITIVVRGNVPWIYLDKVNNNKVKEVGNGGNNGFNIAWYPTRLGEGIKLADTKETFKIIRKYK